MVYFCVILGSKFCFSRSISMKLRLNTVTVDQREVIHFSENKVPIKIYIIMIFLSYKYIYVLLYYYYLYHR